MTVFNLTATLSPGHTVLRLSVSTSHSSSALSIPLPRPTTFWLAFFVIFPFNFTLQLRMVFAKLAVIRLVFLGLFVFKTFRKYNLSISKMSASIVVTYCKIGKKILHVYYAIILSFKEHLVVTGLFFDSLAKFSDTSCCFLRAFFIIMFLYLSP